MIIAPLRWTRVHHIRAACTCLRRRSATSCGCTRLIRSVRWLFCGIVWLNCCWAARCSGLNSGLVGASIVRAHWCGCGSRRPRSSKVGNFSFQSPNALSAGPCASQKRASAQHLLENVVLDLFDTLLDVSNHRAAQAVILIPLIALLPIRHGTFLHFRFVVHLYRQRSILHRHRQLVHRHSTLNTRERTLILTPQTCHEQEGVSEEDRHSTSLLFCAQARRLRRCRPCTTFESNTPDLAF